MEEKQSIRINIADRFYPLKIERNREEKIRKAARMINEKLLQYKQKYADKDTQDFLAMAALQYVIRVIEHEEKTDVSPVLEDLRELDQELDVYLREE